MKPIIAINAHKRYSQFFVQSRACVFLEECRVDHCRVATAAFLEHWPDSEEMTG